MVGLTALLTQFSLYSAPLDLLVYNSSHKFTLLQMSTILVQAEC